MRRQAAPAPRFPEGTVPLSRENVVQPSLFDEKRTYTLPLVTEGQEAMVIDADYNWKTWNGRRGIVTGYNYFNAHHTITFEGSHGSYEGRFLGREIMKIR